MKKLITLITFLLFLEKNVYSAEAGMPQLDPEYWPSQIFWLIIIFLNLFYKHKNYHQHKTYC